MGRTTACLRFFGEFLDPDEITRLIGTPPSASERKNDLVGPRKRVARQGSWRLEVAERDPADLTSQIEEILARTTPELSVWKQLTQDYRADLFCGAFLRASNEELHISPAALLKLGDRGIQLSLDIYGQPQSDDAPETGSSLTTPS